MSDNNYVQFLRRCIYKITSLKNDKNQLTHLNRVLTEENAELKVRTLRTDRLQAKIIKKQDELIKKLNEELKVKDGIIAEVTKVNEGNKRGKKPKDEVIFYYI